MKLVYHLGIALIALSVISCQSTDDNNHALDYTSLDVHFSASITGATWGSEDVVGVAASCTREGVENTPMSIKQPAQYVPISSGETAVLVSKTEDDKIIAMSSDHNFKFYAYAPYNAAITSMDALTADIPANVNFQDEPNVLRIAKATATGVIAPVSLSFNSISCLVELQVPDAIVAEANTVLSKMVLKATEPANLSQDLAYNATYNLYNDQLNIAPGTGSKEICVDFGPTGYAMETGYTKVTFLMAPFTVPVDAFELEFTDINGNTNTIPFLDKNEGEEYVAGELIAATLSSSGDGVIPCTSPVEWPIGFNSDSTPRFLISNDVKDLWVNMHTWISTQPQASLTYNIHEDNPLGSGVKFEANNFKQYNYNAPCVKGTWTGDYFEFDIPVKKFKANTVVTLSFPAYGRGAPLFWDVQYLDGEEWKCNRTSFTSPDGQFTKDCTLMMEHGNRDGSFEGILYQVQIPFEHEIKSGHLYIRLTCADGSLITVDSGTYSTTCKVLSEPNTKGNSLFAFVNKSGTLANSIKIEW